MAFKRSGGFGGGGFKRGGFRSGGERPRFGGGFGGDRDAARGGKELFEAVCADCGTTCEVPFRPNGKKPVYCKACFPKHGGDDRGGRDFAPRPQPRFERRDFAPRAPERREFTPRPAAPDTRIDALVRDVAALNAKIDSLIAATLPTTTPAAPASATPAKTEKRPSAKPAAKKSAKAAKPVKKAKK